MKIKRLKVYIFSIITMFCIELPKNIHSFVGIGVSTDEPPMQIFIKSMTGCTDTFYVKTTMTIYELQLMYQNKWEIPVDQLRFIFAGKLLVNTDTISMIGIQKEGTIHIVQRLRGGMYHESSGFAGLNPYNPFNLIIIKPDQTEVSVTVNPLEVCEDFIRRFLFNEHLNGIDLSVYTEKKMHIDKELDKGLQSYLYGASKIYFE